MGPGESRWSSPPCVSHSDSAGYKPDPMTPGSRWLGGCARAADGATHRKNQLPAASVAPWIPEGRGEGRSRVRLAEERRRWLVHRWCAGEEGEQRERWEGAARCRGGARSREEGGDADAARRGKRRGGAARWMQGMGKRRCRVGWGPTRRCMAGRVPARGGGGARWGCAEACDAG